jgi:hypothetical protein
MAQSWIPLVLEAISKVRTQVGRKQMPKEVRQLIFRMVAENASWGAPRIHGELLMLGIDVSERTISRWMKRAPKDPEPAKRWLAFLRNHREAIAAMDFFTVPTATFSVLYCFFVISHDRRRILHFDVTKHPASTWIVQQLREAFPFGPGCEIRFGSAVRRSISKDEPCADLLRQSLAEWNCGALGRQLPPRTVGSHHCS